MINKSRKITLPIYFDNEGVKNNFGINKSQLLATFQIIKSPFLAHVISEFTCDSINKLTIL